MKLRMKENSIRLRLVRSELVRLQSGESIHEIVRFGLEPSQALHYALSVAAQPEPVSVAFQSSQISVTLSPDQLRSWAEESQVGIYASLAIDHTTTLEVSIEKDFACLDRSDEDNADTFANPLAGTIC
ncbi:DUF7009 family protein [Granulicella tundricola]|uniref:Uncharacterized protein n=1 Tax=Granulicella tundricola (strain ATCC BAA-1859 / DSM 23138 / MP5ACTX9) TaxID=1198114 RepID=E8X6Q0_GRATM|nr:hypothetical protein [Granulicella tundricola]ADW71200.1 hypothetical protein AciX9_3924 [Granulicella tundricola MP5ACTX9]